jgi:hypothetical protein
LVFQIQHFESRMLNLFIKNIECGGTKIWKGGPTKTLEAGPTISMSFLLKSL